MSEAITYSFDGTIAQIGLDRVAKRNALSSELSRQLREAIARASAEAKVGVIFGHGDHFSAGLDLKEAATWINDPDARFKRRSGHNSCPYDDVARGRIPFVAAIRGACVGGGFEIAAACHVRVADETAFFALPEGKRGIFLGGGGSVTITRLVGPARVMDMMLTGRLLSASEAHQCGAVQYVTPPNGHLERARQVAALIAENPAVCNWAIINGIQRSQDLSRDDGYFVEALLVGATAGSESQRRLTDFIEKRAPSIKVE